MTTAIDKRLNTPSKTLLSPGHRACAGCGQMIAARTVADALGPNTIIVNATGCLEVVTTPYPESAWGMPWIHSLFENAAPIASGIRAALDYKSKHSKKEIKSPIGDLISTNKSEVKVVAQGGDGATFDIGFGLISGMWARGENILYVCYDNEAYMNTGVQSSAATPLGAETTTAPAGSTSNKKDILAIALAHGLKYVAQTTVAYPFDIANKVKKAIATAGPSYLQILVPCIPGWRIEPSQTIKLAKLAAQTGIYPVVEYVNGQLANSLKISQPPIKVEEYLKPQGRFKHLFRDESGKRQLTTIQKLADENIKKYNLTLPSPCLPQAG